jgi:NAD+ kinase
MPENHEIHIELLEDPQFVSLTLDGQEHIELKGADIITIKKNKIKNIRFIKNKNKSYFRNLSNIFTYGKRIKTYES